MTKIVDGAHFTNPFALKNGTLVHVDSVPRGKDCGCVCPGCDGLLVAAQGDVRAHYFRHDVAPGNCSWYSSVGGAEETEWHRAAKLWFVGIKTIAGLDFRQMVSVQCLDGSLLHEEVVVPFPLNTVSKVEIEKPIEGFRPDVVLTFDDGRELWVEVTVSSKPSPEKIKFLTNRRTEAVEIQVPRGSIDTVTSAAIANNVVSTASKVTWIFHQEGFALVEAARVRLKVQKEIRDAEWLEKQRVREDAANAERAEAQKRRKEADDLLQAQRRADSERPQPPRPATPNGGVSLTSGPTLLHNLNPEQLAAVTLPAEHALILAGAGSGKTRVLTTRIAWLLQNGYVSPGGILAVTFTNKAAKEMMTRLSAMLPVNVRGMWIGTFHGLCNRFLRAHYKNAGLPQAFQILDTQDQLSALKRLCKQYNIDTERFPPKQLGWFIGNCKEEGLRPKDVVASDPDTRKKVEVYQLYEDQCQREGVVDFGELMLRSYELLRDNTPIREHYQRRFRHILIDEFQDTNKLQYAWIKMIAGQGNDGLLNGGGGAVLAVGDDDQSIYAFRGARVGNMTDFVREFAVRQQIKLEENYRSYSNILDSANALISHNSRRLGKNLRTAQGAGEPVRVYEAPSDFLEAQWMVDEIKQLIRDDVERKEIAVLYRSNAQSRVIETGLFNAAIPYRVYGGLRFFERAEVKHALAYLRLLENPHDDTSFLRVVNFPARGIGARSIELLQDEAKATGCSLHDAVSTLTGRPGALIAGFVAKIDVLREQTAAMNLKDIIKQMLEHSGLLEFYRNDKEGEDRIENLDELVNAAESFVMQEGFGREAAGMKPLPSAPSAFLSQSPASQGLTGDLLMAPAEEELGDTGETLSPLQAFLSHAALEAGDNMAAAGQDAIQLMTVHSAKGLEFDCVFITGMEEGLFPHENSLSDHEGLEEERRLAYVAITRARKRLYLSHSQTRMLHGQTRYNLKSRFFDELPEECLKYLTPKQQPMLAGGGMRGFGSSWGGGYAPNSGAGRAYSTGATGQFGSYSAPQKEIPRKEEPTGLRKGQKVFHTKFGEGTVLTLEGAGDDARAQINFPRHGTKWLALSVAKLTPVP